MNEELKQTTDGAGPASSIMSKPPEEKTTVQDMLACVQKYFKDCSYDCGKNYMDGYNVELLKDKLDMSTLLTSLTRMVFDEVRRQEHLTDENKIELSLIFQSLEKLLQVVKHSNKTVAGDDILCKIIGYCIKNHQTYK